jgi:multidrug efflux pump
MKLTEVCVQRPVLAWMIMLSTLVFGGVAASRIGISQFPDIDIPTVAVQMHWEGAAPEAMERDVVELVEDAVVQVEGVKTVFSASRLGEATTVAEIDLSRNIDTAMQDIQTKLAQIQARLPRDMYAPVVSKINPEDHPILWIVLSGPLAPRELSDYARYHLKEKLQTVPGVGDVMMGGFLERNIRIWIDANKLNQFNVTISDVMQALQREHVELPAGRIENAAREINIRILGEAFDLETLRNIVIKSDGGTPLYLHNVSLVEDGFEDARKKARFNGLPAQALGIKKQRGANAVTVAQAIRSTLTDISKTLPPNMHTEITFDSTRFIKESVHEIEFEIVLAVLLTALVCWLFLGSLSSTLNVLLAIPMSLFGAIAIIYFCGFTLNTFTLLALGLSVGIVVDDAIMVLENIFRHRELGESRINAALFGTQEITFAALAATLAVVAIFVPVIFMKGIVGKFFFQFGVTLSVAVLLSYIEAVTLAPARCAQFLEIGHRQTRLGHAVDTMFDKLATFYERVLQRSLHHPWRVLAIGAGTFVLAIFIFTRLPGEFVPAQDQSQLMLSVETAVSSNLEETDRLVARMENYLHQQPEVEHELVVLGGTLNSSGVNTAMLYITLVPPERRKMSQSAFANQLRKEFSTYPGIAVSLIDASQAAFTAQRGAQIEFSIRGSDWNKLVELSESVKAQLQQSGAVVDLDSDYRVGMPELRITPDRARTADAGVSVEQVAATINALVSGITVGKYSSEGRRVDVRMRLLAEQRSRPEDLNQLRVTSNKGELTPVASLVTTQELPALQTINRRGRERAISIYANVAPGHSQSEVVDLVGKLTANMPQGYHAVLEGMSVAFKESIEGLVFALFLGIVIAYMILASQFNSFLHPITVLTILPLSIAGAALALWGTQQSLNIMSMIGLLLLMGIVKKNSIILVDYATQARTQGLSAAEAMLKAGPVRLRPILMTSIATMMAVVPAALALGPGAEMRRPMAIGIIGGLVLSTALSLLVVPAFYLVADNALHKIKIKFKRAPHAQ